MANYLAINQERTTSRFFRDLCDVIIDGQVREKGKLVAKRKEVKQPYMIKCGHIIEKPYRIYGKTRKALSLGTVMELTTEDAIAFLSKQGMDFDQINAELSFDDQQVKEEVVIDPPLEKEVKEVIENGTTELVEEEKAPKKRGRKKQDIN